MRKLVIPLSLGALFLASGHSPVWAGVIFEQQHNPVGGSGADTVWNDPFNGDLWQQPADDFWFTELSRVDRVVWRGYYGGTFYGSYDPPQGTETMRLRIYSARPSDGLPGQVLREQTTSNTLKTPTGAIVGDGGPHPEFQYEMDLDTPFITEISTLYWLEVVQVGDASSMFRWVYSPRTGTPYAVTNGFVPDWVRIPDGPNLCFQLHGVPEPHGVLLFVTVLMTCDRIRERREARRHAARRPPRRRSSAAACPARIQFCDLTNPPRPTTFHS